MFDTHATTQLIIAGLPRNLMTDRRIRDSSDPQWGQLPTFDPTACQVIADALQSVIASLIASLKGAGPEWDAIMEDEDLNDALKLTIGDW